MILHKQGVGFSCSLILLYTIYKKRLDYTLEPRMTTKTPFIRLWLWF